MTLTVPRMTSSAVRCHQICCYSDTQACNIVFALIWLRKCLRQGLPRSRLVLRR